MDFSSTGYCLDSSRNPCDSCNKHCSHPRPSTPKDLKSFSTSNAIGGTKNEVPFDIIFATSEENKRGEFAYRDLRKWFNGTFLKWGIPEAIAKEGKARVGFLSICRQK